MNKEKKSIKTMNLILIIIGIFIFLFVVTMIIVHITTGSTPDTLIGCVFALCGGECGVMGWIKSTKEKYKDREYQLDDRKHQEELEARSIQQIVSKT